MSRQGLYKRVKSKQDLFDWMALLVCQMAMNAVVIAAKDEGKPLIDRLSQIFDEWAGGFVEMSQGSPHATEILARINSVSIKSENNSERLREIISKLLISEEAVQDQSQAEDCAYTMYMASKWLMATSNNRREFNEGMKRVFAAIFRD